MRSTGDPATVFETVIPHAANNFANGECAYIYVGVAGNVVAICDGTVTTFTALANGWHPIRCTRINAIGTTATNMLAAYVTR